MKMTTLLVIDASGKLSPDAEFILSRPDRHGSFEMCDRVWKTGKRPLTEFDRTVLIVARAHGQVGRTYLPVSATHTDVRLRLHRAPDATLTGCVTDEFGRPVSGATIAYKPLGPWVSFPWRPPLLLGQIVTTSDRAGRFTLTNVWPEEPGWLAVGKVGWTGTQVPLKPRAGRKLTVSPRLTHSRLSVAGRILDASGRPVAQARITADGSATRVQSLTDNQGRFHVRGVEPGFCALTAADATGRRTGFARLLFPGSRNTDIVVTVREWPHSR